MTSPEAPGTAPDELVTGRRIASNSILTLATGLFVLVSGIVIIPFTIDAFGRELYALLTITWMLSAHLAWLDFGLSRAAAKFVAHDLALGERERAASWGWTAITSQVFLGLIGTVGLWFGAPAILHGLKVDPAHAQLGLLTIRVFATTIPLALATRSLLGVLQAGQRFGWVNVYSIIYSFGTYGAYAAGILLNDSFRTVIWGLFSVQVGTSVFAFVGAARVVPLLASPFRELWWSKAYRSRLREMFRFGGWIALATLLGPLLLYFDQWIVGFVLGAAILPYYSVPFALVTRLGVFSSSLTQTLFPAFSSLSAREEDSRIGEVFIRAHRFLVAATIPPLFIVYVWATPLLTIWIGASFAKHAATPLRILALGQVIGLLAPLSGALLQGVGRPAAIALLYVVELPFNIFFVYFMTRAFLLNGAAASFTIRTVIETIVLWFVVARLFAFGPRARELFRHTLRDGGLMVGVMVAVALALPARDEIAIPVTIAAIASYTVFVLMRLFDTNDRLLLRSLVRRVAS